MQRTVFDADQEAFRSVVREFLALKVHQLFVVDRAGVLVGVISTLDVLRHLAIAA